MQLERVAVRIEEDGNVANPGVDRLATELHALGLELGPRLLDIVDPKGDRHLVRPRLEVRAHRLGRDERERHVAELVLDPAFPGIRVALQAERLAVELVGASEVLNGDSYEVGALDPEISQPTLPSGAGSGGSSRPRTPAGAPS